MKRAALTDPRYYFNRHVQWLEHSRILYFENGGKPEIYLGSADWMPRNLYERVEVLFPLKDPQLRERIMSEILPAYLADTRKARLLAPNGTYSLPRAARNGQGFSVQEQFMRLASEAPRSGAISAPLDHTAGEVQSGSAPDSDESSTNAASNATV
jgi:polyphosphate kinase